MSVSSVSSVDERDKRQMPLEIALRIAVDPSTRFGKPVIKGTRVPVELVIAKLAGGMTSEQVAQEYGITLEDVRAALSYAASGPGRRRGAGGRLIVGVLETCPARRLLP